MDRPLFCDDIVARKDDEEALAVVERTHGDVDSHEPYPDRDEEVAIIKHQSIDQATFRRFMKNGVPPRGTALVRWTDAPNASLIPESELKLVDRSLMMGDVVRRTGQDAMSGVVINTETLCSLRPVTDISYKRHHTLKGLIPMTEVSHDYSIASPGAVPLIVDVPASELRYAESPIEEDLVIYKDWLGHFAKLTCMIVLKLADGCVVEISDGLAEHPSTENESFSVGDIAQTKKGHLRTGRWIFGQYNANTPPVGTVVEVRPVTAHILWLERRIGSGDDSEPLMLHERDELESGDMHIYDRTRRPRNNDQELSVSETVSNSELDIRLGLIVRFKDLSGACVKYDGSRNGGRLPRIDRKDTLGYDLNVFDIACFRTSVTVQWQDLTISTHLSIDLVPDSSIDDEHAVWPGEIAHTLDFRPEVSMPGIEEPTRTGVIQSVKAAERMAQIRWCPKANLQFTCTAENAETASAAKMRSLVCGMVGRATGDVQEISLYDIEAPAAMNLRRGDIVLIIWDAFRDRNDKDIDWLGEIVDTCLDGTLIVRLGAAQEVRDLKLTREQVVVAIRSDATGGVEDFTEAEEIMHEMENPEMIPDGDGQLGAWQDDDEDEWDSDEEEEEEPKATYQDEYGEPMDEEEVENEEWESEEEDEEMLDATQQTRASSNSATPPRLSEASSQPTEAAQPSSTATRQPEVYLVLDTKAPQDHHYSSQPSPENSTRMKRIQKEHKILRSPGAIPPGVFVRTWENRLDLFRALLIGPADTPYEHAPFVIDFYLPSDYPSAPPEAFFHSWPGESGLGGVGRVNPNLYEDGKICLSLLGTWEGGKGEGWSAARSTLLQVVVSLLGLVLVSEPYFNEAGYEPLAGLQDSKRPSVLYNERTFLRSRTFIISALSRLRLAEGIALLPGLAGLEGELEWLYSAAEGPKLLERARQQAEDVLRRSEEGTAEPDGRAVMSKGACIPLKRIMERLRRLT